MSVHAYRINQIRSKSARRTQMLARPKLKEGGQRIQVQVLARRANGRETVEREVRKRGRRSLKCHVSIGRKNVWNLKSGLCSDKC